MSRLFVDLLDAPGSGPPPANLTDYFERTLPLRAASSSSVEHAARAGAAGDRLGYAFAGGYEAALDRLLPGGGRMSLAVTEQGGGHPRAIATRLAPRSGGFTVTGSKTFATLAGVADVLLVVASEGERNGRNALRLVRVPRTRTGVTLRDLPDLPFAPEIPHTEVEFGAVEISEEEVLPGDGFERYLKPFRTIEDVHVLAAAIGYLVRCAREYAWPRDVIEGLFADLAALVTLGAGDPRDRGVHIALTGVLASARAHIDGLAPHWASAPDDVRDRWLRDRVLLAVADRVRAARAEAAWKGAVPAKGE